MSRYEWRWTSERSLHFWCEESESMHLVPESLQQMLLTAYPNIVRAVVPSAGGVLVEIDAVQARHVDPRSMAARLSEGQKSLPSDSSPAPVLEIPVCYESPFAPDLPLVADTTGLSIDEIVSAHSGPVYTATSIGFIPGFGYLSSLDISLRLPRRSTPRTRVPSGSVGIAETHTGVYPVECPGGWHIIGRTPMTLFDPYRSPPTPLRVGQRVKFRPIEPDAFHRIEAVITDGAEP